MGNSMAVNWEGNDLLFSLNLDNNLHTRALPLYQRGPSSSEEHLFWSRFFLVLYMNRRVHTTLLSFGHLFPMTRSTKMANRNLLW